MRISVMTPAFFDTNILLENIINPSFRPVFNKLVVEYEVIIHESVLLELGNLTKKYFGSKITSQIISKLISEFKIFSLEIGQIQAGIQIMDKYDFNKPNKDYTLTDSILIHCTEKYGFSLISYDFEMSLFSWKKGNFVHIKL
jgi:predicted nucleic acid-binding protein